MNHIWSIELRGPVPKDGCGELGFVAHVTRTEEDSDVLGKRLNGNYFIDSTDPVSAMAFVSKTIENQDSWRDSVIAKQESNVRWI